VPEVAAPVLPVTGSTTMPLTATGGAFVLCGALVLVVARRRE
jgi:LPXTG-motif cell wall-anchored protein